MKKFFSLLCAMMLWAGVANAESGLCGPNLMWSYNWDGVLTITGNGEMSNDYFNDWSNAPWSNYQYSITSVVFPQGLTSIASYAFWYCENLKSIEIPENVTSIGYYAFANTGIKEITIPNSVTSISDDAFQGITNVIYFGKATGAPWGAKGVNAYMENGWVFDDVTKTKLLSVPSDLEGEVVIPETVTQIGNGAFQNCSSITSVTLPDGITSIGANAFAGCSKLTSFTIPDGITKIEQGTFSSCNNLKEVIIPNSVTDIEYSAFNSCRSLTSITLPNSVTKIGGYAFSYCQNLTEITIPNSVTTIEYDAFYSCTGLTSITIPASVTTIGNSVFGGCTNLTSILVDSENPNYSSDNGVLFNKDKTTIIQYPSGKTETSYTIPNSVTSIGNYAFSNCTDLTSIIIPNSVTCIGGSAFSGCTGLTSIIIPNSVTSIGDYAFGNTAFERDENNW